MNCLIVRITWVLIDTINIGNHMNSSAIWEIIALSHAFEEM